MEAVGGVSGTGLMKRSGGRRNRSKVAATWDVLVGQVEAAAHIILSLRLKTLRD
jgi:hypothetical protein